ncbi:MAG: dCTP deaminase [Dehalococcoidales bacterium]|jgi:dCTP deaminase|nr:dCTP deaminase [Dehalococcoidia bacterium]NCG35179.1 dCTP deaminase [Dehalococcoidales bacterium]|tara:strand:+ start:459 stop:1043 length:585 start_codon:yes stop_codon:yes gene_type:complete
MVLSDRDIKAAVKAGIIGIDPYFEKDVQPASVDLHLDKKLLVFNNSNAPFIDLKKELPDLNSPVLIKDDEPFILHPGEFVLGSTLEKITIPSNMVARIEGKSSLGRLGLLIHSTAGFVDPGFDGNLTLELANVSRLPITLYYGMRIGQISFQQMLSEAERPYGSPELKSRYQGQIDPTESRVFKDFEKQISKKK